MLAILLLVCAVLAISAVARARDARLRRFLVVALSVGAGACGTAEPMTPGHPAAARALDAAPAPAAVPDAQGYRDKHLVFDDELDGGPVPQAHADLRWGNYIDREGRPAVGLHSHDPATGNAR
jgi:hypothetical protein